MKRGKFGKIGNDRAVLVFTFSRVAPFSLRPVFSRFVRYSSLSVIVLCNSVQRFDFLIVSPVCFCIQLNNFIIRVNTICFQC